MPEVRERKKSDKIKGKGKGTGSSPAKNDVRRQMTAKLKKELVERQKGRSTGGATGQTPEVQAAEQVEASIYTTADSLRDHTADAVSKSIARYKRKQQKKKQRTEPATGEAAPADVEAPQPPQIRERAAGDLRTRPTENSRPADPVRERSAQPRHPPRKSVCGRTPSKKSGIGAQAPGRGPPIPRGSSRQYTDRPPQPAGRGQPSRSRRSV